MRNRQNEELLLKIQYAARRKYNCAEKMIFWSFWLSFVPLLSIVPALDFLKKAEPFVVIGLDLVILLMTILYTRFVEEGASYKAYFDLYVFGFGIENNVQNTKIKEKALQTFNKHVNQANIQIANTGTDTPPGVKDWYTFIAAKNDSDAVYKCQVENAWWTSKMLLWKWVSLAITFGVLILIAAFLKFVVEVDWCELIIALVGITVKLLERMICAIRFLFASIRVDGAVKVLSTNRTKKQLLNLQELIDEQRRIPFVPSNRMHKKKARELSLLYREINLD